MLRVCTPHLRHAAAALALLASAVASAGPVPGQGTWETTLQPRDINSDGTVDAFYDTVLKVTWLADAKAGAGSAFDNGLSATDGAMTWTNANAWAASLNVHGTTGWRLPTMLDTGAPGCERIVFGGTDCGYNPLTISADGQTVYSEMAHLYLAALGNRSYCEATGGCAEGRFNAPNFMLSNTGNFRNLQAAGYWTDVDWASPNMGIAWVFYFNAGTQDGFFQSGERSALAVRPGDVATPVRMTGRCRRRAIALGRRSHRQRSCPPRPTPSNRPPPARIVVAERPR